LCPPPKKKSFKFEIISKHLFLTCIPPCS
jgi:hypothetical protein